MNILEVRNLKILCYQKAVDDISLEIPREAYLVYWVQWRRQNNAHPDDNRIFFPMQRDHGKGKKFDPENDAKYIGYMPEERGLYKKMKIGEQALYLAQLRIKPRDALSRIKDWFKRFEMESWWNKK